MNNNIHSKKWVAKRLKILKRDKYRDMYLFNKHGIIKPATIVHHILPRDKYPEYTWEDWNLISVSEYTHKNILHKRIGNNLTKAGEQLMRETAFINGIKLQTTTLVIGNPNSGNTTFVQKHIGGGLAYDLDYIAAAFRLKKPKEENHEGSRKMANRLLKGFIVEAPKNAGEIYIIRTAPYLEELYSISPDKLIVCIGGNDIGVQERINETIDYAEKNNIHIEYVNKASK